MILKQPKKYYVVLDKINDTDEDIIGITESEELAKEIASRDKHYTWDIVYEIK